MIVELDVPARMRDGVTLSANVFRPEGAGPWPTLLARTPYGKDLPGVVSWLDPVQTARRGFMVVIQDTRGRFASDGEWVPFRFERDDGYDAVEWAARLSGSNGRVGMYGLSYWGNSQWLAASQRPRSLAAISPAMTWSDPMDGLFARGGALELGLAVPWSLQQGIDHLGRMSAGEAEVRRRIDAVIDDYDRLVADGYWDLPVREIAVVRRHDIPDLGSIRALAEPDTAEWCRVTGSYHDVKVPTFHTAGWHDIFLQGTLDNYVAMAQSGCDSRLVVGPWTHSEFADPIGSELFGARASRLGAPIHGDADHNDLQLAWFRAHLVPEASVDVPDVPVRIFVMGRNQWRDEASWPPQRATLQRWFLGFDGSLSDAAPATDDPPTEFVYDPRDPVPTIGGHTVMSPAFRAGPIDQAVIEVRSDVCVFTSPVLQDDLEVTGRVRVVIHARSSAPSTDWVARLCDVHPDGRSLNLCDGIVRVTERADLCTRHEIDLWSTSNVFMRGHRLRVHVTSSNFPRWDRNLNTGNQAQARHEVARQQIYHYADRPSYIELPVIT